jgi:hypothetical protein
MHTGYNRIASNGKGLVMCDHTAKDSQSLSQLLTPKLQIRRIASNGTRRFIFCDQNHIPNTRRKETDKEVSES